MDKKDKYHLPEEHRMEIEGMQGLDSIETWKVSKQWKASHGFKRVVTSLSEIDLGRERRSFIHL